MISTKTLLAGALCFLLVISCSASGLSSLVLEGPELHASLKTRQLDDSIRHLPKGVVPPKNPHVSTDAGFVEAIARSGSQGRLGSAGIRSVLYALYVGERELGFYGLEAASAADANRREDALRKIWSKNVSLDRARVHRKGLVLVVVWTDGVSPECWAAVNARVIERLAAPAPPRVELQSQKPADNQESDTTKNNKPMKLGSFSVSLAVKDIKASRAFYEKLGFHSVMGEPAQNWLILRNGTTTIGLFQGMFEDNIMTFNPGWDHEAKPLKDFEDIREIQKRLKASGLKLNSEAEETGTGPVSLTLSDPDGNVILID